MGRSAGIVLAVVLFLAAAIFPTAKAQTVAPASDITELQSSADRGDAEAQAILSVMHALGMSVAPSNEDASHWLARANTQGDAAAQYACGVAYDLGMWGFEANQEEANRWYRLAADHGIADAQEALGDLYWFGPEVDRDDRKAIEWYLKAAAQGKAGAESSLGFIYELSKTIPVDLSEAAKWYRLAAAQNDADPEPPESFAEPNIIPFSFHYALAHGGRESAITPKTRAAIDRALGDCAHKDKVVGLLRKDVTNLSAQLDKVVAPMMYSRPIPMPIRVAGSASA